MSGVCQILPDTCQIFYRYRFSLPCRNVGKYIHRSQRSEIFILGAIWKVNYGIIITWNLMCPNDLLNIAKKKNFPILSTGMATSQLSLASFTYLQEKLAPSTSVHASLVEIYSMGVMILGQSGIGKSETTLELIKKGHRLIADDRIDITYVRDELFGEAPELLSGMMEVRGIGIIDVKKMFGINSLIKRKKIRNKKSNRQIT